MSGNNGAAERYIWIARWEEFQHYPPERDRPPAWIKTYTRQLDDDRYRTLTAYSRGLLHDLRMTFSRAHGELTTNTRQLTHRVGYRVLTSNLETLNHAGFIEFISRATLDQRLEQLYASRARDRAHQREVEKDGEQEQDTPEGPSVSEPSASAPASLSAARETEPDEDIDLGPPTNGDPPANGLEPETQTAYRQHVRATIAASPIGQGQGH